MSKDTFKRLFPNREHVFLPVIHAVDEEHVLRNARIAHEEGADGVFLINHHTRMVPALRLIKMMRTVQAHIPDFPVGLNCLDLSSIDALLGIPLDTPMLWCDDGGIHTEQQFPLAQAHLFVNERAIRGWDGLYFGGVAFKGQPEVYRPQDAALVAVGLIDVITTSGDTTGEPPGLNKVAFMGANCGSTPLAIASGMSPENVREYLPHASAFLVATSILAEKKPGSFVDEFDRTRVRAFREATL